jgi:large subunit ribosomal protein L13
MESLESLMSRKPAEALRKAVSGMLPKNKLRKQRLANLYIYAGEEHPHEAQLGKQND